MHNLTLDNCIINYQVFFKNIKHMYLRVKNDILQVTANKRFTLKMIEAFIIKHKRWILKQLSLKKIALYDKEGMYLWGEKYPVKTLDDQANNQFKNETFYISNLKSSSIENIYHQVVQNQLKIILEEEQDSLNQIFDLNALTFKTQLMRTRLGSCHSQKKIIKINSLLGRLDKEYLKLVLFHELAHLNHQNHSSHFHDLLEKIYPNHRSKQTELSRLVRAFNHTY